MHANYSHLSQFGSYNVKYLYINEPFFLLNFAGHENKKAHLITHTKCYKGKAKTNTPTPTCASGVYLEPQQLFREYIFLINIHSGPNLNNDADITPAKSHADATFITRRTRLAPPAGPQGRADVGLNGSLDRRRHGKDRDAWGRERGEEGQQTERKMA